MPGKSTQETGRTTIQGRHVERSTIAALLAGARASHSGALVLAADIGVGKTTLLEHAAATADGFTVLHSRGVESETELAFGGLHRLLRPLTPRLAALPAPQAEALAGALQLAPAPRVDRLLISVAVLSLLSEAAERQPVLCRVDDLHWLDLPSVDALAFAARRLEAEGIVMLFASRDEPAPDLPVLRLAGLDPPSCAALLRDRAAGPVHPAVDEPLLRHAAGNPLALVELVDTLSPAQLSGQEPLPEPLPLGAGLRQAYRGRIRGLPADTQRLLLLAAADPDIDPALLLRAAEIAEIDVAALEAAEDAGLVRVTSAEVRFRHPLVRTALYQGASLPQRQWAHQVLARVFDDDPHSDRRAWHRAAAALGPHDTLAGELEATARRARTRSGYAAAAVALERAAALTRDDEIRARRLTAAARDAWQAGRAAHSLALLGRATPLARRPDLRGEIEWVRGDIELHRGQVTDAYATLLAAANRLSSTNVELAARALIGAGEASSYAGDLGRLFEAGRRAAALGKGIKSRETQLMLDFLAGTRAVFAGNTETGVGLLRGVVAEAEPLDDPAALVRAGLAALILGDDTAAHASAAGAVAAARAGGAVATVPYALEALVHAELWTGRYATAHVNALEGLRLARETGQDNRACVQLSHLAYLSAVAGHEAECRDRIHQALGPASAHGLGLPTALCGWAQAFLDLSMGRVGQATARLHRLATAGPGSGHPGITVLTVPHLVEAAVRHGAPACDPGTVGPLRALESYLRWARAAGNPALLAIGARCRALLAARDGALATADEHFREALRLHTTRSWDFEHARTELLYGEMLRRTHRGGPARPHLAHALEVFERTGAAVWERRTRAELRATGAAAHSPDTPDSSGLTPQQVRIARFVAQGATNREMAAQLFLSPRTVDYHLRRIFAKLGICSRTELARLAAQDRGPLGGA